MDRTVVDIIEVVVVIIFAIVSVAVTFAIISVVVIFAIVSVVVILLDRAVARAVIIGTVRPVSIRMASSANILPGPLDTAASRSIADIFAVIELRFGDGVF